MFRFKQFIIHQDHTPMKVGTDGVLLGAWAALEQAERILDIGTGTGLIALMAAQRNPSAHIDAIEIEKDAYSEARDNILSSPWAQRIQIYQIALQDYFTAQPYDHIVCNPPFFIHSTKTPADGRNLARHCDSLAHNELIDHVIRLLSPEGYFSVILPVREAEDLITYARSRQLYPIHITHVLPNPGKAPKRKLIRFAFSPLSTIIEDELAIEVSRHQYTSSYIRLTKDFYLKM